MTALRPSLEAAADGADQPLDVAGLATAVGYPEDAVTEALLALAAEYDEQGRGFELRNVAGGWRYYTRDEYAAVVEGFVARGPAGPAHPGRAGDAGRGGLQAADLARPRLRDPGRQRRRRDAHAADPRPGRGGRPGRTRPAPTCIRTTRYFLERIGVTSLDELPELAPYLPDMDDLEDELAEMAAPAPSHGGGRRP